MKITIYVANITNIHKLTQHLVQKLEKYGSDAFSQTCRTVFFRQEMLFEQVDSTSPPRP